MPKGPSLMHLAVLASCTELSLALGRVLISLTSHHPDDVNSGILLATSVSSLAISIFLIIAVTLYPQPRKCLQQHLQQASLVHNFFFGIVAVNRTRDSLGLEETRVAQQNLPAEYQSDHFGHNCEYYSSFLEKTDISPLTLSNTDKCLCYLPTTPGNSPRYLQPRQTADLEDAFLRQERQQQKMSSVPTGSRARGSLVY